MRSGTAPRAAGVADARVVRALGLDFSGARDAGRHAWLAEVVPVDAGAADAPAPRLRLTRCAPIAVWLDCDPARETCLPRLAQWLAAQAGAVVGCDFPFGLPQALLPAGGWAEFVDTFAARYPTPEVFRAACQAAAGGREWRRPCEVAARVPWCAYNLRLYRQAWWGLAQVLQPLRADGRAAVWPYEDGRPASAGPWLLEACPASVLRRWGSYGAAPYKGRGPGPAQQRAALLAVAMAAGPPLVVTPGLRATLVADPGGDALDSVLAALAAWRYAHDPAARAALHAVPAVAAALANEGVVAY